MFLDLQNLNAELRELNPPQLRDRLIYEAVVLKNCGQCAVAAEHGISQPRVSQIVAEVGEWLDRVLPGTRRYEQGGGGMAVGTFVVESQIDFLLQQTMELWNEGRQDKVIKKSGKGGVEQWEETITMSNQCAKVGLLNTALRLAQAKAKLAGVDITGRTQREMAFAEERQRRQAMAQGEESGDRKQETVEPEKLRAKKPLIKKMEISAVEAETAQPQVQAGNEDKQRDEREEFIKKTACKQLINHLRSDPGCAGWTDKQFQEYAERVSDSLSRKGGTAETAEMVPPNSEDVGGREEFSRRRPLPTPGKNRERQAMQRRKDQPLSPQERHREFFAPLAAG